MDYHTKFESKLTWGLMLGELPTDRPRSSQDEVRQAQEFDGRDLPGPGRLEAGLS
jgi:hypothetical protein